MRLMGAVDFPLKALMIVLAFLVPLVWLSWSYFSTKNGNIAFSAKERLGVEYNRAVFPVLRYAQDLRRDALAQTATGQAPASMADTKNKLQAAQEVLSRVEQRLGSELGTSKLHSDMRNAFSAALAASGTPQAVLQAHAAHVRSVLDLLVQATDGSNLTLDPDIDTYYLMDAAFFRIPELTEAIGLTRGVGGRVLLAGKADFEDSKLLDEQNAVARYLFSGMKSGLPKSYAVTPELAGKIRFEEVERATEAYLTLVESTFSKPIEAPAPELAQTLVAQANQVLEAQYQLADRLMTELDALLAKRVDRMATERLWTTVVLVLGLGLSAYFFYCFYRVANGGLRQLAGHLEQMAAGDLRHIPATPWAKDEIGRLLVGLADTYRSLNELIRKVRHGAGELHNASNEIAAASGDLSTRTEAAAASLEEQASAMEEIGSTVTHTAGTAQEAAEFSVRNARLADQAGDTIQQVVSTMQRIHASSAKISDIIGVIDSIAFQTNMLALNAAVEAARAGEQGRGFAVVAGEVHSLAQRSASAAKEIKELISASVEQIDDGTRVVQGAGEIMAEVVKSARQINTLLSEIATASKEQAAGVEQVRQAIQELDRNTQQNAAMVEETSAAAAALKAQAELLQKEIANFRVA
jgi:methyl-accepting chemotaxis protein